MSKYPHLAKLITYSSVTGHISRAIKIQYDRLSILKSVWDDDFHIDYLDEDVVRERVDEPLKSAMLDTLREIDRLHFLADAVESEIELFRSEYGEKK